MLTDEDRSRDDIFVASLARELSDSDRVFVGANQLDVALAAYLARRTRAPKLKIWAAGTVALDPTQDLFMVGRRSYDPVVIAARATSFRHAQAFEDTRRPVVFAGGLQIDGCGNANLIGIPDRTGGWTLRGPGSAGLASLTALSSRFYLVTPRHDPRVLVERCAALSVLGDPVARAGLGLPPNSLAALITPLATFVPTVDGLRLAAIAPGVGRNELQQRTGFPIVDAPHVTCRRPLDETEAAALGELRRAALANRAGP